MLIKELNHANNKIKVIVKDPNEHIQKRWMSGVFYEVQRNGLLNRIYELHKNKRKFVDIGACIGNHTLFFSSICKAQSVYSFEPVRKNYNHLLENLKLNNLANVKTYMVALGEKETAGMMENNSAGAPTLNIGMWQIKDDSQGDIKIQQLDSFYQELFDFDVIKIDVEHYNEKLLKGAKEVLSKGKGYVYIESEDSLTLKITDELMSEYGYTRNTKVMFNHTPTYEYYKL